MKKADVEIGAVYCAKVSGQLTWVKIVDVCHFGGWMGKNLKTDRSIRIKSAQRLRYRAAEGQHSTLGGTPHVAV